MHTAWHISEWFYRKFFVYSITTTLPHREIDIRKCIKSKPRAASNSCVAVQHTDRCTTPLLLNSVRFFYLYSFRSSPIFFCTKFEIYHRVDAVSKSASSLHSLLQLLLKFLFNNLKNTSIILYICYRY